MEVIIIEDIKKIINDNLELLFRYNNRVLKEISYYMYDFGYDLETEEMEMIVRYVLKELLSLENMYDFRER